MNDENLYRNLVLLIKLFKNRPYHLAKYLIENSAFTEDFIIAVSDSVKLKNIDIDKPDDSKLPIIYFTDINKMNDYYNSLTEENNGKSKEEIERDLNDRLVQFINDERYEDAARLRDYMNRNNIKRDKLN
jgi:hypothetical protein